MRRTERRQQHQLLQMRRSHWSCVLLSENLSQVQKDLFGQSGYLRGLSHPSHNVHQKFDLRFRQWPRGLDVCNCHFVTYNWYHPGTDLSGPQGRFHWKIPVNCRYCGKYCVGGALLFDFQCLLTVFRDIVSYDLAVEHWLEIMSAFDID